MRQTPRTAAIVLAGGSGSRMRQAMPAKEQAPGGDNTPPKKQFLTLGESPLVCHSLRVFEASPLINDIILVAGKDDIAFCEKEIVAAGSFSKVRRVVAGGKERYHSVHAGLTALYEMLPDGVRDGEPQRIVLIHDGARPFVTEEIIGRVLDGVQRSGAAVASVPVKDTIKAADAEGFVTETPDRRFLRAMQTPQGFFLDLACTAYRRLIAEAEGLTQAAAHSETEGLLQAAGATPGEPISDFLARLTDDAMVVERYFPAQPVLLVDGAYANLKITTPEDLALARAMCAGNTAGK